MAEWICTDPDCAQYQKDLGDGFYEMWQVQAGPEWKYYMVASGVVSVDWTDDELDGLCRTYGYESLAHFMDENGDDSEGIIAECIFEHGIFYDYLTDGYSPRLKHPTFATYDEAEKYIKQMIGRED